MRPTADIDVRSRFGPLETPVHGDPPEVEQLGMPWRDNAFFLFWDAERDVYGAVHASSSPTGDGCVARCSVALGDRSREVVEPLPRGSFASQSVAIDLAGGVEVDHPEIGLDLDVAPLFGPLDFTHDRALGEAGDSHPLHHHQHPMRARGVVRIAQEERAFDGHGWRDRSWGFRDEAAQWEEYFCVTAVFEDMAIVGLKMRLAGQEERVFGWRTTAEGLAPVREVSVARDGAGLLAEARLAGDGYELGLEAVCRTAGFWAPMGGRREGPAFAAYDEFLVLRRDDGVNAAGMAEHGILRRLS